LRSLLLRIGTFKMVEVTFIVAVAGVMDPCGKVYPREALEKIVLDKPERFRMDGDKLLCKLVSDQQGEALNLSREMDWPE